jgi:tRNA(Ile)-lysidine synthase
VAQLRPKARDVDYALIKRALDFAESPSATRQSDLGLGLRIYLEQDRLIISDWDQDVPIGRFPQISAQHQLQIPGNLALGSGWWLVARVPDDDEIVFNDVGQNTDPFQVWFDLGDRPNLLSVRSRKPGDRFRPAGMGGKSMKISDFMINQKIPRRWRANWPLVCIDDEIIWVPGYRLGHPFMLSKPSSNIFCLVIESNQV